VDRTLVALGLAAPLLVAAARLSPRPPTYLVSTGVTEERFWVMKARLPPSFDLVLAGDSRVYRGLSPAAMREVLKGRRIANFGFPGCGLTRPYLEAASALLDPGSQAPAIVVGVTPHSLTPHAARDNGFLAEKKRPWMQANMRMYLAPVERTFAPIDPNTSLKVWLHPEEFGYGRYFEDFHEDGWVASRHEPERPDQALGEYRRVLEPVSADILDELFDHVRRWNSAGRRVFGFRPPTSDAMAGLEVSMTRFDEARFVEGFEHAGGVWLRPEAAYHSYDGSHLREDSAIQLSRDLATAMAASPAPTGQAIPSR